MAVDLGKLNKEQKEAVLHKTGPLLIVAGAGTGKTTVITQRIVNLLEKKLALPEEILAVTFTEKAAFEMEERVDKLLDFGYMDLWISTFHSFCERVLRENALDIGLPNDFKILDQTSAWLLARQNLDKFGLKYYKALGNPTKFIQALISHFSHCKDQDLRPENYLEYAEALKTRDDGPEDQETERIKEVAEAYHIYQQILLENSSLDFGDLINYCLKLFKKRPHILKKYQEKFKYILVDEFQDTNWSQYELIKLLAEPANNLTVCADDDQCLPSNSKIEIFENGKIINKKIKNIKTGDEVLTAVGKGHIGVSKVNNIFAKANKTKLLSIKTENGYSIEVTDNHKMLCCIPRTSRGNYHYVYLMFRKGLGWRIGVTDDLILRLRLERSADKILAIGAFNTDVDARYHETLWSLKYGIPTNCFKDRERVVIKNNILAKLYKDIDVTANVQKLAEDLNIDLGSYHYCLNAVKRGNSTRIIINLQMCYRKYRSKGHVKNKNKILLNGWISHRLYLETSDGQTIKILKSAGYDFLKTKGGSRLNIESVDLQKIEKEARKIEKITGGFIEYKFNVASKYIQASGNQRNYMSLVMPAKNLVLGHYFPVRKGKEIFYDKIISIEETEKTVKVYDLEIDKTHNFIANGIVVHNCIYRWRGASYSNIVYFQKDFPKAKQVSLIKNYRSSQNILDKSYNFIKQNDPDRLEFRIKINKKLVAVNEPASAQGSGEAKQGIIEHIHAKSLDQEVGQTLKKILEILKSDKKANYNDFAILVRANDHAVPFIKALERANLPYQFLASRGLYSKPIILDIISYFKLLDNYHEGSAVYRVLNLPVLEISDTDIANITQYSRRKTKSLFDSLQELAIVPGVSAKTQEKVAFVLSLIKKHSQMARERGVSEILVAFLEDSGYLKYLVHNNQTNKLDLLNQFYKKVKTFEESSIEPLLKNFMEEMTLELESGEEGKLEFDPETGPDMIKVMTIHGAKGLEFKYVFLVNMVDRRFPTDQRKDPIELPDALIKDIKPKGDVHLAEERRLCYVAMTRAKRGLYFTSAEDYGGQRKKKISRFLAEMGYKVQDDAKRDMLVSGGARDGRGPLVGPSRVHEANKHIPRSPVSSQFLPQHFSYSQLAAFEKCPLQYKFAFILKVPTRGKAVFSFGKTMHNTLHEFLKLVNEPTFAKASAGKEKNLFGEEISKKQKMKNSIFNELMKLYEKNWIGEWYEDQKQKDDYFKKGKDIIKDFYKNYEKNPPTILKIGDALALEMPFNLKIGGYTLYGVIDRIDQLPGGVAIIDYKTGKSKNKLDFESKEQLLIYQIAAEEVLHLKPKQLAYYYLDDGKLASFLGSEADLQKQKEKIIELAGKIKNSEFEPTPGWQCQYCDFKDICDYAQR